MNQSRAQQDGFLLLCLGLFAFVLVGFGVRLVHRDTPMDVRMAYASARCLIHHYDPYQPADVVRMYEETGGPPPSDSGHISILRFESMYVYFPTIFLFTTPLSAFPFSVFCVFWISLVASSFLLASLLMWDVARQYAPLLSGALLALTLANCGSAISAANAGTLAVSLAIISVWTFFRERFELGGVLCLAASLAIKPHDSGLVWLCLVLLGGVSRRRAIQSLVLYVCISLPTLFWVSHIAPNWIPQLESNIATLSSHGAVSDPGPSTVFSRGALMITNLQSAASLFRDDPRFYNAVSLSVCLLLLGVLALITLRSQRTKLNGWLAIASVAALSMLPVYHRLYDAKLLILMIPACAMLWERGGQRAKLALILTGLALFVTAELPWAFYLVYAGNRHFEGSLFSLVVASIAVPIPLALLIATIFYLITYANESRAILADPTKAASGPVSVA